MYIIQELYISKEGIKNDFGCIDDIKNERIMSNEWNSKLGGNTDSFSVT